MSKFEERIQLFRMETAHEEAPRVPVLSNVWSWKIQDSGYKLSEAVFDPEILKSSMYTFHEKYNFDAYYETNYRNPLFISQALGNVNHIIDDDRNALTYLDQCYMSPEDYDLLIANPEKYFWTKFIPGKYEGVTKENIKVALIKFVEYFMDIFNGIPQTMAEKYEVPRFVENFTFASFENLGCGMRGLKELSMDVRRNPAKVEEAVQALDQYFNQIGELRYTTQPGKSQHAVLDVGVVVLAHTLLNRKAFERFYMPFFKNISDYLEEYDKTAFLFLEGDNTRLWDYFKDFPKDRYMFYLESDDIYEAKKAIGDVVALAGGLHSTTLASGTPEQCIEEAKKAVDILGVGGGYVVTTDKMISFTNDCRSENLKAVNDFLTGYYK